MMTENQRDQMIRDTYDTVVQLKTVILGVNGQGGCFRRHEKTALDFYAFRRFMLVAMAFSAGGGGAIGAGLMKLIID